MALDYNGKEIKDLVYLTVKDGFCEVTEFLLFEGVRTFLQHGRLLYVIANCTLFSLTSSSQGIALANGKNQWKVK